MIIEREHRPDIDRELLLPASADVVIVGGGLSGLYLLKDLGHSVDVVLLDKRRAHQYKGAMYLTSRNVTEKWGLEDDFNNRSAHRPLISGVIAFSPAGKVIDQVKPADLNQYGYFPFPQTALEANLKKRIDTRRIYREVECHFVTNATDGEVIVSTNKGSIKTKLVIDATGWQGNLIHKYYGSEADNLFALFGGNSKTKGFDPRLLYFIRFIPNNNRNWVLPISSNGSEVMAAKETRRSEMNEWWNSEAEKAFKDMVEWYREHNFQINAEDKAMETMAFRVEPAASNYFKGSIVPFGEAAGQNSPLWGQLIDVLPHYSKILSRIIIEAKSNNTWDNIGKKFFDEFLRNPPYQYLLHTLMRRNVQLHEKTGLPVNRLIFRALRDTFDNNTLWKLQQENGLGLQELSVLLRKRPFEVIAWIFASSPMLLYILCTQPDLFQQFFLSTHRRLLKKMESRRRMG